MTFELARALLNAEAIAPVPLAKALFTVASEGVPMPRALVALGIMTEERLEEELARVDVPKVQHVVAVPELMELLPAGLCSRLMALPIRKDPRTGTIDVAVVDARDPHAANEVGFFLQSPVRVVRASMAALEGALDHAQSHTHRAEALAPLLTASVAPPARLPLKGSSIPPPRHPSAEMPIPLLKRNNTVPHFGAPPSLPPEYDEEGPETVEDDVVLELRATRMRPRQPSIPERSPSVAPPSSLPAFPFPDSSSVLAAIRSASSRDEILASLLLGVRSVARKAGLLVAKKDHFAGWMCNAELGDSSAFRLVQIPSVVPSIFTTAAAGHTYLGPLYRDRVSAPLLDVMGSTSRDVALTPVRVLGKTAVLVVADDLGDTMLGTKSMEELARAAGEALARVVRRRQ